MLTRSVQIRPALLFAIVTLSLGPLLGLTGCRSSAPDDLIQQVATTDALVFVKTTATETLNRTWADGNLYKLSPISPDGVVSPITNFTGASITDPAVSYDGTKILFAMRPPGGVWKNIYEINADGTGLRQVTSGGGHDFDPLYLPDGRIMFTSSRANEMDEYNHALTANLYVCDANGMNMERISYNQSDDFDPEMLPNGRVMYTRWEHFGTFNRFPLFATNPDGTGTFHLFGPHDHNFFHPSPTPDGRYIGIESTMILGDAGPIAVMKTEQGPADPATGGTQLHWDIVTPQINDNGPPWPYGVFKYPRSLGGNKYVVSYSLPAATETDVDYGLYTFTLSQTGAGTIADPATFSINNLTFLYNDPTTNEYDAQLLAAHPKPPVIPSVVDNTVDYGVFLAQDVFNRGTNDGQEVPIKGVDVIDSIMVIAARPTPQGEGNDYSANDFEKRAFIGMAPVYPDGSFRIKIPANTPISFATLDTTGRAFVVKRTHLYVRPGEEFKNCFGCHEDRVAGGPVPTNPNPMAANFPPFDLDMPAANFQIINYESTIGPIVAAKCVSCHQGGAPAGGLDLTAVQDTASEMRIFPRGYINLSGASLKLTTQETDPPFPHRSRLIDYVMGVGTRAGQGVHPSDPADTLTAVERRQFLLWVTMGAQYK